MSRKLYCENDIWDAVEDYLGLRHAEDLKDEIRKKPCIYADLPDGMDGKLYHIEKNETRVYHGSTSDDIVDYTCEVSDVSNEDWNEGLDWELVHRLVFSLKCDVNDHMIASDEVISYANRIDEITKKYRKEVEKNGNKV